MQNRAPPGWRAAGARYTAGVGSQGRNATPFASFAVAGLLLVLLAGLAVLQYHWIGEISRAERERRAARLEADTQRFAAEFDRELALVCAAFMPRLGEADMALDERLRARHAAWTDTAPHARVLDELLLAERAPDGSLGLLRFEPQSGRLERAEWSADLRGVRERLEAGSRARLEGSEPEGGEHALALLAEVPALVVPAAFGDEHPALIIARLDRAYLADVLLPELAQRHFGGRSGEYDLAVVRRGTSGDALIWRSGPDVSLENLRRPDASTDMFGLRPFAELRPRGPRFGRRGPGPHGFGPPPHVHRGAPARVPGPPLGLAGPGGAWRLLVRHHDGSLEAAVSRARWHNLVVSAAVLSLLASSVVFLAASTRRAHALSRQQLEFVAGVTHELHTPLAGIRSAAQNLHDGVVQGPEQVRRYGALIEKEGRRLSELLQQVLEFAGIHGGRRPLRRERVDARALVEEAVQACRFVIEEHGARVETDLPESLPPLEADPDALRTALRNLVANAAKYGGGWLRVAARVQDRRALELRVEDRGPGIDTDERRRIFEPFYRGRGARAGQAAGSGLGLSIVRDVVAAHGGSVEVKPRVEGGSVFTLRLPLARAEAPA